MANDWDKVPKWAREQYMRLERERDDLRRQALIEASGNDARVRVVNRRDPLLTRGVPEDSPVRFDLDDRHTIEVSLTYEPHARPIINISSVHGPILVMSVSSNLIRVGSEDR